MKKTKFILISVFVAFSTLAIAQIPNANFENWTSLKGYDTPNGWDNINSITIMDSIITCEKGTPGNMGEAYLRLISRAMDSTHVMPGIAVSGKLDLLSLRPKSGFAYTQRPTALTGSWQFMAPGDDHGFVAVYFTKWNAATHKRDSIGSGLGILYGMAMGWTDFEVPITYSNTSKPDSCIIVLSASGSTPLDGSYLFVDNLAFIGASKIIENTQKVGIIHTFPNPVTNTLYIDLTALKATVQSIQITNLQGKILMQNSVVQTKIDVSELSTGIYLLTINTENGSITQKFNKQ